MKIEIRVPYGTTYPGYFSEAEGTRAPSAFLSDSELAAATSKLPVVCTDVVLIDTQGRFVLAKRRHACARGWWWKGGGLNQDKTPEENIERLLTREIGQVPRHVVFIDQFFHHWSDTRERPGGQRLDLIFLHACVVTEEQIASLVLDPKEYEVEAGFTRYTGDGSVATVRPVIEHAYRRFRNISESQPDLFR